MNRAPDCDQCKAWDEKPDVPGFGYCRRHAPSAEIVMIASDDGIEFPSTVTVLPTTAAKGEGCFDHLYMPIIEETNGEMRAMTGTPIV